MTSEQADSIPSCFASEDLCRVGDPDLDAQHLRMFHALERLDESLRGPFPLATLGARLKQLEDYVLDHFRDEEARLELIQYPLLLPHRAEHEVLVERCRGLIDQFSSPDSPPLTSLPEIFATIFLAHIRDVDKAYAGFLEEAKRT
ncbi:MAG: hemerythrin domain-containing protein [Holophaga sp.]|nr:hemerythrin domain-containing protein [Holophaga sp.]